MRAPIVLRPSNVAMTITIEPHPRAPEVEPAMSLTSDNTRPVLVLWDIDHTLIETRGVGRAAFADAFQRVTGHPLQQMSSVTGRTENDIYTDTVALHDIPDPPPFTRFAEALASA